MTFSEKLTMILQALGIRNAELARASGLDPSAVSRLRTGRRGAAPGGPQMRKLVDGLCLLAGERGNIPKLLTLCNGDNAPRLPEAFAPHPTAACSRNSCAGILFGKPRSSSRLESSGAW